MSIAHVITMCGILQAKCSHIQQQTPASLHCVACLGPSMLKNTFWDRLSQMKISSMNRKKKSRERFCSVSLYSAHRGIMAHYGLYRTGLLSEAWSKANVGQPSWCPCLHRDPLHSPSSCLRTELSCYWLSYTWCLVRGRSCQLVSCPPVLQAQLFLLSDTYGNDTI